MRRFVCLVAFLTVAAYIWALRTDWFTEAARSPLGRNPLYSDRLDLSKPQTISWTVPKDGWIFRNGMAMLGLAINVHELREMPKDRRQVDLRMKVSAFGVRRDGSREDRLIKDWYFVTDEPFSKAGDGLWESWGYGQVEFGLAEVEIKDDEQTVIQIDLTTPDPVLNKGIPRLRLVGYHDYAGLPLQSLLVKSLRDGGFIVSLGFLTILFLLAWGFGKRRVAVARLTDAR
jgi:hypothetical protein